MGREIAYRTIFGDKQVGLLSEIEIERLENKGYAIAGKTHVGEFGLDLVGEFSYYSDKEEILKGE